MGRHRKICVALLFIKYLHHHRYSYFASRLLSKLIQKTVYLSMAMFDFIKQLFGTPKEQKSVEETVIPEVPIIDPSALKKNIFFEPNKERQNDTKSVINVYSGNPFRGKTIPLQEQPVQQEQQMPQPQSLSDSVLPPIPPITA